MVRTLSTRSSDSSPSEIHSMQEFLSPHRNNNSSSNNTNNQPSNMDAGGVDYHRLKNSSTPLSLQSGTQTGHGASRPTAQALYDVHSVPTSRQQLRALVKKNFKVRSRDLAQTMNAVFQPVWMMLVLVFLHLSTKKAAPHLQVQSLKFLSNDTCTAGTDACTFFGYTGVPATDPIIAELQSFFTASEPLTVTPKLFASVSDMNSEYQNNPKNFVVGVVFYNASTALTQPTVPGAPQTPFKYDIKVNHTAYSTYQYIDSRFATAQAYVDRAAINLRRKANGKTPLSSPLPLKGVDPGTATTGAGRSFVSWAVFAGTATSTNSALNAFYVIFCFQSVWLGVLSILVVEKDSKIRMGMTMMGMDQNAYLLSVWLLQNMQNVITCALMVFILFVGKIFESSNAGIVFLLLILFSFNATAFGTMASIFVPDPKKTNGVSFVILILTVGSYGAALATFYNKIPPIDPTKETLLFLVPPIALGRAINYITNIELAVGAVNFSNVMQGPVGRALFMLAVDAVIFSFLGWYLDNVFPGQTGYGLPFDFFLRRSYWGLGEYQNTGANAMVATPALNHQDTTVDPAQVHPDMFERVDLSSIPAADRGVIQVQNLRKEYRTKSGWAYHLPFFRFIFPILIPQNPSRTSGPFACEEVKQVVAGLNLQVHRNEILGFLGHNGAGKTTSLSIMMGMIRPNSGRVLVNGQLLPGSDGVDNRDMDLRTLSEVQKTMGVCPQHDVLFQTLTAWETIHLYAAIKGVQVRGLRNGQPKAHGDAALTPAEQAQLLDDYLDHLLQDVYLQDKKHERVSTFSGGMKRKLSVALAFLGDPKVVLLDEPTTGMDVYTRKQVWQLMQDSKQNRSIILTTHSMEEADALGDRIAILSHGQLQTLGSSLFLKNRFGLGYRLNLEKRRAMLVDSKKSTAAVANSAGGDKQEIEDESNVVLFDEAKTTAIVRHYFPSAEIDTNTTTDITYILPTTLAQQNKQHEEAAATSLENISAFSTNESKLVLPELFAHLDREIAANRLGVKSVGLELTTLEEVFVRLQEQEEEEKLAALENI